MIVQAICGDGSSFCSLNVVNLLTIHSKSQEKGPASRRSQIFHGFYLTFHHYFAFLVQFLGIKRHMIHSLKQVIQLVFVWEC